MAALLHRPPVLALGCAVVASLNRPCGASSDPSALIGRSFGRRSGLDLMPGYSRRELPRPACAYPSPSPSSLSLHARLTTGSPAPTLPPSASSSFSSLSASGAVQAAAPFVVPAAHIQAACAALGLTPVQYLTSLLKGLTPLARPPISKFHVASFGLGESGQAYGGVNVEIPGLPLHHSVHAEQFVVANALQHGERRLLHIVVNHPPCGHCRQFLQELRNAESILVAIADQQAETSSLHHFLPHRFGPQDLLHEDFPLLLEPQHHRLTLCTPSTPAASRSQNGPVAGQLHSMGGWQHPSLIDRMVTVGQSSPSPKGSAALEGAKDPLVEAALAAANASYAPYSHSPSGVALLLASGEVVSGSYLESAAYNPSLPALQSAMVALVSQTGAKFGSICEAVLVEHEAAVIQFEDTTRLALSRLSPSASFRALTATSP